MSRDLLPPVMGAVVGLGTALAVATFPSGTLTVGGVAGVGTGLLTAVAFRVLPRYLRIEKPAAPDPDVDDGSGERPVWEARDMDRLSPHAAWANGNSILPHGDDTQERPKPALDQTHSMRGDEVFSRHGRHRAGAR